MTRKLQETTTITNESSELLPLLHFQDRLQAQVVMLLMPHDMMTMAFLLWRFENKFIVLTLGSFQSLQH